MRIFLSVILLLCGEPYWAWALLLWKVMDR